MAMVQAANQLSQLSRSSRYAMSQRLKARARRIHFTAKAKPSYVALHWWTWGRMCNYDVPNISFAVLHGSRWRSLDSYGRAVGALVPQNKSSRVRRARVYVIDPDRFLISQRRVIALAVRQCGYLGQIANGLIDWRAGLVGYGFVACALSLDRADTGVCQAWRVSVDLAHCQNIGASGRAGVERMLDQQSVVRTPLAVDEHFFAP